MAARTRRAQSASHKPLTPSLLSMDMLIAFPAALWAILLELAPSLLVGLFIAGLIHAYVPSAVIRRGLSRPDLGSVVRASLVGVPLPLC
ncbi:MAG: hypothetical protein C1943_07465, partial [Halochromatium sp.]|nr:hypothetical protein [Halochromatium sp.]